MDEEERGSDEGRRLPPIPFLDPADGALAPDKTDQITPGHNLTAQVLLNHQRRDRSSRRTTVADVLDNHAHCDLRIVSRRVRDEHRVILTAGVLRRPRLAGDRDLREVPPGLDPRTTRRTPCFLNHAGHARLDDR